MPSSRITGRVVGLQLAEPQRILALQGRDRLHRVGLADGLGTGFRQAEMLDLALGDQVLDRPGHVLDRHVGIDAVLVEQVDHLDAQALQRGLGHLADVLGLAVDAAHAGIALARAFRRDVEAELGGDHDLVAERLQAFADQLLVRIGAVDLGGVEEGHAQLDRAGQHLEGVGLVQRRAVDLAHPHAAQTDGRDFQAVAEFARLHGSS
jgi:hypothetical protein